MPAARQPRLLLDVLPNPLPQGGDAAKRPNPEGRKPPENATVATALLADLVERGLDTGQGVLCVLDGAKALRKAVRSVLGEVPIQRCIRHYADLRVMPLCVWNPPQGADLAVLRSA